MALSGLGIGSKGAFNPSSPSLPQNKKSTGTDESTQKQRKEEERKREEEQGCTNVYLNAIIEGIDHSGCRIRNKFKKNVERHLVLV